MDNTFAISDQFGTVVINRSTLREKDGVAVSSLGQTIPHSIVKITQSTLMSGANGIAIIAGDGDVWTLRSTIVAKSNSSPYRDCSGHVHSLGFNLADDGSCNLGRQGDQPNTEPLLRPLGSYGGPTNTFALSTASPAIDAGRVAGTAQTDQRGLPRKVDYPGISTAIGGDNSDIGAFELQSP
jgi:hypothetical protein